MGKASLLLETWWCPARSRPSWRITLKDMGRGTESPSSTRLRPVRPPFALAQRLRSGVMETSHPHGERKSARAGTLSAHATRMSELTATRARPKENDSVNTNDSPPKENDDALAARTETGSRRRALFRGVSLAAGAGLALATILKSSRAAADAGDASLLNALLSAEWSDRCVHRGRRVPSPPLRAPTRWSRPLPRSSRSPNTSHHNTRITRRSSARP